jgi:hypothetical protein
MAGSSEQGNERRVLSSGIERRGKTACFHATILLGIFDPEYGGDIFLRNVG